MNVKAPNQTSIASIWETALSSAQLHAASMSRLCVHPFSNLIEREFKALAGQELPDSREELKSLQEQNIQLSAKIQSIMHASVMAELSPNAADAMYDATTEFCDQNPLTSECSSAAKALATLMHRLSRDSAA